MSVSVVMVEQVLFFSRVGAGVWSASLCSLFVRSWKNGALEMKMVYDGCEINDISM